MIELMTFRLRDGIEVSDFVEADRKVQVGFAYQQPGLLRRTTARSGDGRWLVVQLWASQDDADAADVNAWSSPEVAAFVALVDNDAVTVERFTALD